MDTRGLITLVLTFHDGIFAISVLISSLIALLLTLLFFKKLPRERQLASILLTFIGSVLLLHFGLSHLLSYKAIDVEVIRLIQTSDDGAIKQKP